MSIIKPERQTLYDSIFNPLLENAKVRIDDSISSAAENNDTTTIAELNKVKEDLEKEESDLRTSMSELSTILTNAIESYVSKLVVEINPGIQVEVKIGRDEVLKGETISKGTSRSTTE